MGVDWLIWENPKSFSHQTFYTLAVSWIQDGWISKYPGCVGTNITWYPRRWRQWPDLFVCAANRNGQQVRAVGKEWRDHRAGCPGSLLHLFREKHLSIEARMWCGTPGNPARFSVEPGIKPRWQLLFSLKQSVRPSAITEQVSSRHGNTGASHALGVGLG